MRVTLSLHLLSVVIRVDDSAVQVVFLLRIIGVRFQLDQVVIVVLLRLLLCAENVTGPVSMRQFNGVLLVVTSGFFGFAWHDVGVEVSW